MRKAMILAAGRGHRLRPLTNNLPKPLVLAKDMPLILHTILSLKKSGFCELVINISYHAKDILLVLGSGEKWGVNITYSFEPEALETGGGIFQALPLLGTLPFLVVSGDIWTDYPFHQLMLKPNSLASLVLVDNPTFHPEGDFALIDSLVNLVGTPKLTFGNIGVYSAEFFAGCQTGKFPLRDVFFQKKNQQKMTGEHYKGTWFNIGTVDDLNQLNNYLENKTG